MHSGSRGQGEGAVECIGQYKHVQNCQVGKETEQKLKRERIALTPKTSF